MNNMQIYLTVKPSLGSLGKAFGSVEVQAVLLDTINKTALSVERFSKQLTPVGKTGMLRGLQHTSPASIGGLKAIVTTGVDYAVYVHEGTRYMRSRPFMAKGAELAVKFLEGDISGRLEREFVKKFKSLH